MRALLLLHASLLVGLICSSAQAVTLIHSNDVLGEIEPCGCRSNPQGGIVRKAGYLKSLAPEPLLQLDAGDLLFPTEIIPDPLRAQSLVQARYLLKAMDRLHHDAVTPGEKDFALGVGEFLKLTSATKIHFLAANLVKRSTGKNLLAANHVFSTRDAQGKTVRVGVFGLVGQKLAWPPELEATNAIGAAKQQVQDLRKKADFIIALTHEELEQDQKLGESVPGIDLIVGGHSQSFLQTPIKAGGSVIVESSFRGQYVGELPLGKPLDLTHYRLGGLDAGYEPQAGDHSMDSLQTLVRDFKQEVALVNARADAAVQPSTGAANGVKFQTFPRCAECHLKQFDFWRKTPHALALRPLVQKAQARNKECLTCHTVGMNDPRGFSGVNHLAELSASPSRGISAESFSSFLEAMHDAKTLQDPVALPSIEKTRENPTPLPIRETLAGIGRAWTPVQCENCHLPGQDHPFGATYSKRVEKNVCLSCHNPERAPEWYLPSGQPNWEKIEAKRASVTCPAGDLAP